MTKFQRTVNRKTKVTIKQNIIYGDVLTFKATRKLIKFNNKLGQKIRKKISKTALLFKGVTLINRKLVRQQ